MKKYLILIMVMVLGIKLAVSIPAIVMTLSPKTDVVYTVVDDCMRTVVCKGKLETSSKIEKTLQIPVVISSVKVKVGDMVKKGQTLFSIDKEKSIELIKEEYSTGDITDYGYSSADIPGVVTADNTGRISEVNIQDGSKLNSGDVAVCINSGSGYSAKITISENDISDIKIGQKVIIGGSAFKDITYDGVISEISDTARQVSVGTSQETVVDAVVDVLSTDSNIRSGFTVKATIVTGVYKNMTILPFESVAQDENNDYYVYKIVNGWAVKQPVNILFDNTKGYVTDTKNIGKNTPLCSSPQKLVGVALRVSANLDGVKY